MGEAKKRRARGGGAVTSDEMLTKTLGDVIAALGAHAHLLIERGLIEPEALGLLPSKTIDADATTNALLAALRRPSNKGDPGRDHACSPVVGVKNPAYILQNMPNSLILKG